MSDMTVVAGDCLVTWIHLDNIEGCVMRFSMIADKDTRDYLEYIRVYEVSVC
jgi:hypothetical protein